MASLKRVNKELRDIFNVYNYDNDNNYLTGQFINLTHHFSLNLNKDYQLDIILTRLDTYQLKLSISIEFRSIYRNRHCVENTYFQIPIYLNKKILEYLPNGKIMMEYLINYPDDYPWRGLIWKYNLSDYQDKKDFKIEDYCQEMIKLHNCQEIDRSLFQTRNV